MKVNKKADPEIQPWGLYKFMPQHMLLLNFMSSPASSAWGKPLLASLPPLLPFSFIPFTSVVVYSLYTSYFLSSFLNCGSGLATWLRSSSQLVPLLRAWPMQFSDGMGRGQRGEKRKEKQPRDGIVKVFLLRSITMQKFDRKITAWQTWLSVW